MEFDYTGLRPNAASGHAHVGPEHLVRFTDANREITDSILPGQSRPESVVRIFDMYQAALDKAREVQKLNDEIDRLRTIASTLNSRLTGKFEVPFIFDEEDMRDLGREAFLTGQGMNGGDFDLTRWIEARKRAKTPHKSHDNERY